MDRRFVSLVSFVTGNIAQVTPTDLDMLIQLSGSLGQVPQQKSQSVVVASPASMSPELTKTWAPVPFLLPGGNDVQPNIRCVVPNVDGDDMFVSTYIYLFNINVRQLTPMGPLLFSQGAAGGSVT